MIAHVVLYRERPDLGKAEREGFRDALGRALTAIPSIRRWQVGRRVVMGTAYDVGAGVDYPWCAVIEFDDQDGLRQYLAHPDHTEVGRLFHACADAMLALDFETVDRDLVQAFARWA